MKSLKFFLPFAFFFVSIPSVFAVEIDTGFIKQNAYETEHYRIEFSDLLMDQRDSNRNGLADVIDTVAEAAEHSYGVLMEDLNYDDPMSDGELLLIILDDTNEYLGGGALGVTSLLSNGDPYVAIDPWLPDEYLEVTVGHELFHTVQFGYGADFAYTYSGINWAESTATWVEDIQYDTNNDYVNYLSDFFDYPDYSVFASIVPSGTLFEYGLNIWPRFLSEYYDNNVIKQIWDAYYASEVSFDSDLRLFGTVQDIVEAKGDDLNEVFRQFTLWNLDLSNYDEGNLYPDLFTLQGVTDDSYQEINNTYAPALYGTNYIYFENSENKASFYFHIQKPEGVRFAVTLVPYDAGDYNVARSTFLIIEAEETMEEALELTSLAGKEGVIAVVSPLDADFSSSNETTDFDEAYVYNFLALFDADGEDLSSLVDTSASDSSSSGSKEGELSTGDKGTVLPDSLTLSVVTYDEDSVTLSWNRLVDEEIASYEIQYGTDEDEPDHAQEVAHDYLTSAIVDDLEEGETYYFQLFALDAEGSEVGEPSTLLVVTPQEWLFSDLSYVHDYYEEVSALVDEGIFSGYTDGTFKPDATINRAELLKILIEGMGETPSTAYKNCFTDVSNEWYARYVCYAKDQGWVSGYNDHSFKPGQTVSKVEALKMLFEVYGVDLDEGDTVSDLPYTDLSNGVWYSIYVKEATELGILAEEPGTEFNAADGRTRGEMALELYRYLVVSDLMSE